MEVVFMKAKPFKGKSLTKKQAAEINAMLINAQKPDHTELKKEAEEFIAAFKARRAIQELNDKSQ